MAFSIPIPADTAIITDDAGVTGWELVDVATGAFLGFAPLPRAGFSESGAVMIHGTLATTDNTSGAGEGVVGLYDLDLVSIVDITLPGSIGNTFPIGITTDRQTYFYIITADAGDNLTVHKVAADGTHLASWPLGFTSTSDPTACAVTRDNALFFFKVVVAGQSRLKQLTLGTGVVTDVGTFGAELVSWLGVDTSGNIYANRSTGGGSGDPVIEKFNANFVSQGTVAAGPAGYTLDVAHFSTYDDHVITWTQKNTSNGLSVKLTIGCYFQGIFAPLQADDLFGSVSAPVRITRTVPANMTLTNASVALSPWTGVAGSVVVDILRNDPNGHVGGPSSIVGGTPPTITNGTSASDSVLSGWTTALTAGDTLTFVIASVSNAQIVFPTLTGTTGNVTGGHPSGFSRFRKIRLSDLAIISTSPDVPTENDSNFITEGQEISNSCPLMISGIPFGLGPPPCLPTAPTIPTLMTGPVGGGTAVTGSDGVIVP